MPTYGFATILENYPAGYEFTVANLPLHLTHVDSLDIDMDADVLEGKLRELLADQRAFTVRAIADELYGPDKDILVTTLELTPQLKKLQIAIMDMLDREGATLKRPQYHREHFAPHVSVYGGRRLTVGQDVLIKDISIAAKVSDAEDANRRILATIPFRHAQ
jgi:hypothetical protein